MKGWALFFLAVGVVGAAPQQQRTPPPPTLGELQALPDDCPLIYDNDWLRDVVDDDYVFLQAHLGRANLKGVVLTKDLWNGGNHYSLEDARRDFDGEYAVIRQMGLRNVPDYKVGATRLLQRPGSGRIEDTPYEESEGARLIVQEARNASPQKPLVVFVGGPLNSVANAYLMDRSIADRMVVMMTDITGYNGKDPWANYIVTTRCRLVNFGASRIWWPKNPPVLDPSRLDALPQNAHIAELKRVLTTFDHSLGDGAGPMLFFKPDSWKAVMPVRVTGVFSFQDAPSGPYDFLDATQVDFNLMAEEFFSVVEKAYAGGGSSGGGSSGGGNMDYAYYEGSWSALPDFGTLTPVKTGKSWGVDISPRLRNDNFGFVFTGTLNVPAGGRWTFFTKSDDGSRLYVDGTLVVNNDGLHAVVEASGTVELQAGSHALRVEYFELGGEESLEVLWEGPGTAKSAIPASAFGNTSGGTQGGDPAGGSGGAPTSGGGREGKEGCGLVGLEAALVVSGIMFWRTRFLRRRPCPRR